MSPGVIVCITTPTRADDDDGDDDDDDDADGSDVESAADDDRLGLEMLQAEVRALWATITEDLQLLQVKEFMMEKRTLSKQVEQQAAVKMWCEALLLRG